MIVHISSWSVMFLIQALTVPTLAHCLSHTRILRTLVILSLGTTGHILSQVSWHFSSKMHTSAVYVKPLHVWNSEYCDASYFQSALIFLKYGCLKKIHENTYQGPLDFKWQGFLLYQFMLFGKFWGSEMLHVIFWGLISDPGIFFWFCLKP